LDWDARGLGLRAHKESLVWAIISYLPFESAEDWGWRRAIRCDIGLRREHTTSKLLDILATPWCRLKSTMDPKGLRMG